MLNGRIMGENRSMPRHVAVIMDGNGRWAQKNGVSRLTGHNQGMLAMKEIIKKADVMGIKYLTVYAFSTENWNRPKDEVDALMKLLGTYMSNCLKTAKKNNMCVKVIGDKTGLSEDMQRRIAQLEEATKDYDGLHFQVALNYGGRDEIRRAVAGLARRVEEGTLKADDITEEMIGNALDTEGIPDPDLMIRTCNELRISNFLLWQLAYTEFYFTEVPWPEFDGEELRKAVEAYTKRDRRFGLVKEP